MLIDAWLLEPGTPVPDEGEPRRIDASPIGVEAGAAFMSEATPGRHDLHVRVTDADTGLSSAIVTAVLNIPADAFVGCTCTSGSLADAFSFAVFMLALRKARRPSAPVTRASSG